MDTRDIDAFREELARVADDLGTPLPSPSLDRLTIHYRLLREWSRRMNLTGLKSRQAILDRHFVEPLVASRYMQGNGTLLDLGSGNGFPAVPLAILHPGARLVLVEASEKKSTFLWIVLREVGLKAAQVVTERACRRADLSRFLPVRWLTFRAVKIEAVLSGPGPDLIEPGGRMMAFVSEAEAARLAATPPSGLQQVAMHHLPKSPGDVVALFEPLITSSATLIEPPRR
jgi:16S rRNA (guanine527-N7)-methyltransferase